MDRRMFLETLAVSAAADPLAGKLQSTPSQAETPAQPATSGRDTGPRVRQNFNAGWLFARQRHGTGEPVSFDRTNGKAAEIEPRFREAYKPEYDDSGWRSIDLPHTWNAYDVSDAKPGYWRGIGWYRKHFKLGDAFARKRVFLEFEGVN